MSVTTLRPGSGDSRPKVTTSTIQQKRDAGERITCLTAYDYATARLVDEAGIDMVLVGDSLSMVVLGHENTMAVTVDEMLHHTRAVRRAVKSALRIADMPYGSYQHNEAPLRPRSREPRRLPEPLRRLPQPQRCRHREI